ncbi:MAG: iron-sulfur cluster assembly scaffold protein [Planctomycetota bacterium]
MKELPDRLAQALVEQRFVGKLEGSSAVGRGTNAACGDLLEVSVGELDGKLRLRFQAQACGAVIAVAAYACEALDGRTRQDVHDFDLAQAVEDLGGLPRHRQHAIRVFERALAEALDGLPA